MPRSQRYIVFQCSKPQSDIEILGDQIHEPRRDVGLEDDCGILRQEFREEGRHETEVARHRDSQAAARLELAVVGEGSSRFAPSWRIKLREMPQRRIALLALPVLDVELVIDAPSGTEAKAFLDRFLLGFQRAGG
jgi:hypothetical protein